MSSCILQDAFGGMMINVDMSTQSELLMDDPALTWLIVRVTPAVFFVVGIYSGARVCG